MNGLVLALCLGSTWFMTGLIWFIQIVHYPLFESVAVDAFPAYHRRHTLRTAWVVFVPMVIELLASAWLAYQPPPGSDRSLGVIGLGASLGCWISTGLLQVPLHERLENGFRDDAWRRLVTTNGLRTALWTVHAVVLSAMLVQALSRV